MFGLCGGPHVNNGLMFKFSYRVLSYAIRRSIWHPMQSTQFLFGCVWCCFGVRVFSIRFMLFLVSLFVFLFMCFVSCSIVSHMFLHMGQVTVSLLCVSPGVPIIYFVAFNIFLLFMFFIVFGLGFSACVLFWCVGVVVEIF